MDERWILIDQDTGLHVSWYFWLRVLDEVNRSSRYGTPFGLLLLDAAADPAFARSHAVEHAPAAVPGSIRSTDLGGLVSPGRAGVLLMHQDPDSARIAVERILGRLEGQTPEGVSWSWKLLCYPEDGAEISMLLTTGADRRAESVDIQLPA